MRAKNNYHEMLAEVSYLAEMEAAGILREWGGAYVWDPRSAEDAPAVVGSTDGITMEEHRVYLAEVGGDGRVSLYGWPRESGRETPSADKGDDLISYLEPAAMAAVIEALPDLGEEGGGPPYIAAWLDGYDTDAQVEEAYTLAAWVYDAPVDGSERWAEKYGDDRHQALFDYYDMMRALCRRATEDKLKAIKDGK